jgi:hypothetical protein
MKVEFEWQTGMPKHNGVYLITDKHHWVVKDTWNGKHWVHHYDEDVMAFCSFIDIPAYKF